jgi:hypothetical protein
MPMPPVHLVAANVGPTQPLPANGRIELQFDRLLLPTSITRQTFVLENAGNTIGYTPAVAYDPVSRIVTVTPLTDPSQALMPGQGYKLIIEPPQTPGDVNGLRAIDGALLGDPSNVIAFNAAAAGPVAPANPTIDFCRDIHPLLEAKCGALSSCHLGGGKNALPAEGLVLAPLQYIRQTAVGLAAHGANTGPQALPSDPTLLFGENMPTIDGNGNASNSWLMYKILLAIPQPPPVVMDAGTAAEDAGVDAAPSSDAGMADAGPASDAGAEDAGVADAGATPVVMVVPPLDVTQIYAPLQITDMSAADRAVLNNYVQGLPMPIIIPGTTGVTGTMTLNELELMNLWISQGTPVPSTCSTASP